MPKLSELRTLAGVDAYVTNPAEAIRKARLEEKDPAGERCLLCSSAKPDFYHCVAICEQSHTKRNDTGGPSDSTELLRWFFFPVIINILLAFRNTNPVIDRCGHDIEVNFLLPVCKQCTATIGNPTRPSVAKRLMIKVPLLAELLKYYPQLKLKITRPE
ncbi:MAG TPA: hypothetical protein VHU84_16900 [Lacipirellulaceae bacterium]|nr:hypothetical protein [Lacipirellulaceae bacterium]